MRFLKGLPPPTPGFPRPNENWSRLREPDMKKMVAWAFVVTNLLTVFGAWAFGLLLPGDALPPLRFLTAFANCTPNLPGGGFLLLFLILPLHEFLHAIWFPHPLGKTTFFGASRDVGGFYAYTTEEMSRERFLVVLLTPVVVLTGLPSAWMIVADQWLPWVMGLVLFNGLASALDLVGVVLVLRQVPAHAQMRNSGILTYWRPALAGVSLSTATQRSR